jgi:hypothetical protein
LLGARNVVVASIIIVPGLALGLSELGELTGEERRPIFRPIMVTLGVGSLMAMVIAAGGRVYSLNGYPVAAVTWAERNHVLGPDARVVSRDFVGNYLEVRYGTRFKVFLDDRFDLFPASVIEDFNILNNGKAGWADVLDRYHASAVIWPTEQALAQLIAVSPQWRVVYTDQEFLIAEPR